MNPQQEIKRKYAGIANYKTVGSANNIINGKEWKRTEISRQKQDKKIIANQPKITNHLPDQNSKNNPKSINFRNLKQTVPVAKKQPVLQIKNPVSYNVKPSAQYFPKAIGISRQPQDSHGISINVNIQNMIPPKQTEGSQVLPLSDRSLIGQQKKNRKPTLTTMNKLDDFQCSEQLVFKRTPIEKKSKIPDKTVQKIPLIDRKQHMKSEVHVKPKDKVLDYKEALKKFESEMQTINSISQAETVSYLDYRQQAYLIHPHYIQKCQKNFTWKMRATLMEWMMHVSYQFSMKRQTFYIAVNLVDLYLSRQYNLHKSDFQLTGAAAMFIASKLQEFQPKSSQQFAKATNTYNAAEVKQTQKKICKALKYTLNPPTSYTWANRFMLQWDTYLQLNQYAKRHPFFATHMPKYFKKWDDQSYKQFRTMMQLLDFATLDIQTVQYQPKLVVCAFMYLVLGKQMGDFKLKQIIHNFPRSSTYMLDDENLFNDLFMNFLQTSFNIMLIDLLPTVQYCATYFILPLNYDDPITGSNNEDSTNMEFEDFCSCQTYNPSMKMAISKRFRGIYQ